MQSTDRDSSPTEYVRSLDRGQRTRELQRITRENQDLMRRIQPAEPTGWDHRGLTAQNARESVPRPGSAVAFRSPPQDAHEIRRAERPRSAAPVRPPPRENDGAEIRRAERPGSAVPLRRRDFEYDEEDDAVVALGLASVDNSLYPSSTKPAAAQTDSQEDAALGTAFTPTPPTSERQASVYEAPLARRRTRQRSPANRPTRQGWTY